MQLLALSEEVATGQGLKPRPRHSGAPRRPPRLAGSGCDSAGTKATHLWHRIMGAGDQVCACLLQTCVTALIVTQGESS